MGKGSKDSADGLATVLGGLVVGVVVVLTFISKQIWIGLGAVVAALVLFVVVYKVFSAVGELNTRIKETPRSQPSAPAPVTKAQRNANSRNENSQHARSIAPKHAAFVQSAQAAVTRVVASEAARAGWLGDVDFTTDIDGITTTFQKVHALRQTADQLAALASPSPDDRKILADAKATADRLERAGVERVKLIEKCATEAKLIDESLRKERQEARTAQQRAELHAKLSAMLYGIEATPDTSQTNSAADAVMARVQAYREIKDQIHQARGSE
jgi:hypothetical protein